MDARTNLRVYAVVGVADDRTADAEALVTVRKIVYTREAADDVVERLNAKADGKKYFWQLTSIEPLG